MSSLSPATNTNDDDDIIRQLWACQDKRDGRLRSSTAIGVREARKGPSFWRPVAFATAEEADVACNLIPSQVVGVVAK